MLVLFMADVEVRQHLQEALLHQVLSFLKHLHVVETINLIFLDLYGGYLKIKCFFQL